MDQRTKNLQWLQSSKPEMFSVNASFQTSSVANGAILEQAFTWATHGLPVGYPMPGVTVLVTPVLNAEEF